MDFTRKRKYFKLMGKSPIRREKMIDSDDLLVKQSLLVQNAVLWSLMFTVELTYFKQYWKYIKGTFYEDEFRRVLYFDFIVAVFFIFLDIVSSVKLFSR